MHHRPFAAAAALVTVAMTLACSGLGSAEEELVEIEEAEEPCCSVDDIVDLHEVGVSTELIVDTIRTSETDLELTATDIVRLTDAGVPDVVVDVLNGGPCVCEEPPPMPEIAVAAGPEPVVPTLNVTVNYSGGRSFELINLGTSNYTGLTLVANGDYQYRLKKLPAGGNDNIRLSTFVSRSNGESLSGKVGMSSLWISADQGQWSKTF